jgi:hypothetical protein
MSDGITDSKFREKRTSEIWRAQRMANKKTFANVVPDIELKATKLANEKLLETIEELRQEIKDCDENYKTLKEELEEKESDNSFYLFYESTNEICADIEKLYDRIRYRKHTLTMKELMEEMETWVRDFTKANNETNF